MPDGFREIHDPLRGRRGNIQASREHIQEGRKREEARLRGDERFQTDPHFRDYVLFYEYFHGDNGAGIGASHQTGWTGLVAKLIQMYGHISSELVLEVSRGAAQVYKKEG